MALICYFIFCVSSIQHLHLNELILKLILKTKITTFHTFKCSFLSQIFRIFILYFIFPPFINFFFLFIYIKNVVFFSRWCQNCNFELNLRCFKIIKLKLIIFWCTFQIKFSCRNLNSFGFIFMQANLSPFSSILY